MQMRYYGISLMRTIAFALVAASAFAQAPVPLPRPTPAPQFPDDLVLSVSTETAPAGAWTQIKVFAAEPRPITAGQLSMDLDPATFAPLDGTSFDIALFSANGDANGYAHASGNHLDAHFWSASGGIGQLPGLPILTVSVPVLATAVPGVTSPVTVDPNATPASNYQPTGPNWAGLNGQAYSVSATSGSLKIAGTLAVQNVTPGGGLLPQGTVVHIYGQGFDSTTNISIDGVALASASLVNSRQIDVTLAAPTEMTGKHVRIANAAREQMDYFAALPSGTTVPPDPSDQYAVASSLRIFVPLTTYTLAQLTYPSNYRRYQTLAIQNPAAGPVTVTFFDLLGLGSPIWGSNIFEKTITLPPGGVFLINTRSLRPGAYVGGSYFISASEPVRLSQYYYQFNVVPRDLEAVVLPSILDPANPDYFSLPQPVVWQVDPNNPPQPQLIAVGEYGFFTGDFAASVPGSARQWLTVSPLAGTLDTGSTLTLTPQTASLPPGVYSGAVNITYQLPPDLASIPPPRASIPVYLTLTAAVPLAANPRGITLQNDNNALIILSAFLNVSTTNGPPVPYSLTVETGSGGNWLSASPSTGTIPASITVYGNRNGLLPYIYTGRVLIHTASTILTVPVTLYPPLHPYFLLPPGSKPSFTSSSLLTYPKGTINHIDVQTQSRGTWLTALNEPTATNDQVAISADATQLGPGTYEGSVTVNASTVIPVTLNVVGPPASVIARPATIALTAAVGETVTRQIQLDSPGSRGMFSLAESNPPGFSAQFQVIDSSVPASTGTYATPALVTPAVVQLQVTGSQPGTYSSAVVFTWTGGSLTVPVTLTVPATPLLPPILSNVVIAPGGLISIFGKGIAGSDVLINGQPARVLRSSGDHIDALVPPQAGHGIATLQLVSNGIASATWGLPLTTEDHPPGRHPK